MPGMRACGSNPPFFPSAYLRLSSLTAPCRTPTEPRLPIPRGLPSSLPVKDSPLDPLAFHARNARVRVEPALLSLGIFEAVELDGALPDADRAEAADPARITQQFAGKGQPPRSPRFPCPECARAGRTRPSFPRHI